jgi:hypothetical protein
LGEHINRSEFYEIIRDKITDETQRYFDTVETNENLKTHITERAEEIVDEQLEEIIDDEDMSDIINTQITKKVSEIVEEKLQMSDWSAKIEQNVNQRLKELATDEKHINKISENILEVAQNKMYDYDDKTIQKAGDKIVEVAVKQLLEDIS